MKHLKDWLDRLKSRPASGHYWKDQHHQEALEALASCDGQDDWIRLSTHGNGFVREAAVRALAEQLSPDALAALLERVNDWVPQIRQLASDGVRLYLTPDQAPALLSALQPFMALVERQRADHAPTLAAARAALQAPEARNQVEEVFVASHGKAARFLFKLLLDVSSEPTALLRNALGHREMTVRQMAVSACKELPAQQARPLLLSALETPGASVRVSVLHALLPLLDDPRPLISDALLDPSHALRSLARWAAPRWQIDARAVLERRLGGKVPNSRKDWLGLLGLASELSVQLDSEWQLQALKAPAISVRLAAVAGLDHADLSQQFMMLDDPSSKVFNLAVERLRNQPWPALAPELDARLGRAWHELPADRRDALMRLRPRWQQLAYLLRRLQQASADHAYWLGQLNGWCERQYLMVDPVTSKAEREELLRSVERMEQDGLLPKGSAKKLH